MGGCKKFVKMKFFVFVLFLCLGSSLYASGAKLVTKSQEEKLIKVLKRWQDVYAEGIEAKEAIQKRGYGAQQQQQQQMNNNNNINIHLHQLQTQVQHYNGYGQPSYHQPSYQRPAYYPSPQAHRYSSSSSRKRRSAGQE